MDNAEKNILNNSYQPGLVSIIIPTFNRAQLCMEAVKSALNQTYTDIEIIVIDDGSTDSTPQIINNLHPKVLYIRQSNGGVTKARNAGINAAHGEFVAFLDSDDIWLPWKIECQLKVLRYFPTAGMVWTDMKAVDKNGTILYESYIAEMYCHYQNFNRDKQFNQQAFLEKVWNSHPEIANGRKCYCGNIFEQMFLGSLVHTSTVLLRRDRLQLVGSFNEELIKSGEDYDFHLRTCLYGDVAYIDVSSISYRIGADDQLTAPEHIVWMARNDLKTITEVLKIATISLPKNIIKQRIARSHAWIGMEEMSENRASSRNHFFKSLLLFPFQKRTFIFFLFSFLPYQAISICRKVKKILGT
jgi:glycosyltransferase involved in cell wall biosynthesis